MDESQIKGEMTRIVVETCNLGNPSDIVASNDLRLFINKRLGQTLSVWDFPKYLLAISEANGWGLVKKRQYFKGGTQATILRISLKDEFQPKDNGMFTLHIPKFTELAFLDKIPSPHPLLQHPPPEPNRVKVPQQRPRGRGKGTRGAKVPGVSRATVRGQREGIKIYKITQDWDQEGNMPGVEEEPAKWKKWADPRFIYFSHRRGQVPGTSKEAETLDFIISEMQTSYYEEHDIALPELPPEQQQHLNVLAQPLTRNTEHTEEVTNEFTPEIWSQYIQNFAKSKQQCTYDEYNRWKTRFGLPWLRYLEGRIGELSNGNPILDECMDQYNFVEDLNGFCARRFADHNIIPVEPNLKIIQPYLQDDTKAFVIKRKTAWKSWADPVYIENTTKVSRLPPNDVTRDQHTTKLDYLNKFYQDYNISKPQIRVIPIIPANFTCRPPAPFKAK